MKTAGYPHAGRVELSGTPLRILHIINSLNPAQGGTVECVRQIGGAIRTGGNVVEVAVCEDTPTSSWIRDFPLQCHPLGPALGKYAFTSRLRPWLKQRGKGYDAWIINGLWQYQGLGASRAAIELGIPYFIYAHGMLDPWNRRAHPLKYVKKFCYWMVAERRTLEAARAVVFTSHEEGELARRYFPSSRWESLIVGNGIAEPPSISTQQVADFRRRNGIDADREVWLFLSRIHPKKGIEALLEAYSAGRFAEGGVTLAIAGEGDAEYVKGLKQMGRALGIEHCVRWLGPLYGEDKWAAFASAQLFVLPSHQENFGIALVEALAMGIPVCTTTAVNIHAEIEGSKSGLIFEDGGKGLIEALNRWRSMTHDDRSAMKRNARHCYEERFRIESAASRLLTAVRAAVEGQASQGRSAP